jgi:hypothetical protein
MKQSIPITDYKPGMLTVLCPRCRQQHWLTIREALFRPDHICSACLAAEQIDYQLQSHRDEPE